ncbi:FAD-binding protein, partial [Acinetobacter sp.]
MAKRNLVLQIMEDLVRESMEFDVVIVGAGPAGLSAAIKIRQLAIENNLN